MRSYISFFLFWVTLSVLLISILLITQYAVIAGSHTTWCPDPRVPMPQGSPTQPSSTHRSNTSLCMKQTSCTCESWKHKIFNHTLSDTQQTSRYLCAIATVGHFLTNPPVRALFLFPWCEQISSRGPCTADNRPMLHLASGITAHLAADRYASQISAWMSWIHIPSICGGKWCEPPEVVITDISIIHGHHCTAQ